MCSAEAKHFPVARIHTKLCSRSRALAAVNRRALCTYVRRFRMYAKLAARFESLHLAVVPHIRTQTHNTNSVSAIMHNNRRF